MAIVELRQGPMRVVSTSVTARGRFVWIEHLVAEILESHPRPWEVRTGRKLDLDGAEHAELHVKSACGKDIGAWPTDKIPEGSMPAGGVRPCAQCTTNRKIVAFERTAIIGSAEARLL